LYPENHSGDPGPQSGNVLKNFQLTTDSRGKLDFDYGKRIAEYISSTMAGTNSYYWLRNNQFVLNRRAANGRIDMSKFQDRLEMNGKVNFANLNWESIKQVNTIVSRLVGRWMTNNEKIVVTAVDSLSQFDKQQEYQAAEFYMHHQEMIQQLEQASGTQIIPKGQYIPEDQNELDIWAAEYLELPEEIMYEKTTNEILAANGFFDVIKEMQLHDSGECGFVGTYTWMDESGVVHVDRVEPENAVYSYSKFNDFRDTTWRGRVLDMKISEFRRKYGAEFGGKLSEEEIWEYAMTAKEYQMDDKIRWLLQWNTMMIRPYDEWNIEMIHFELKSLDKDDYTITETLQNKRTFVDKGMPTGPLKDNQEYVADEYWNIYEGMYARTKCNMLSWGLKKNMIRPQDPKEIGSVEFSYSFYMHQNYQMRNIAIPQKISEPVDQMILALLRIQQLIAKMRPNGSQINTRAMREVDLGLADGTKPFDVKKVFDQTGDLYYTDMDAEGNIIQGPPVTAAPDDGFLPKLQGLISDYQFHQSVLRDELGEDPNLITQAAKPRVTSDNIQVAQSQSLLATDYFYDSWINCIKDTAKKVCCLIHDSVRWGSQAYRALLNEQMVEGRIFTSDIEFMPTEQEQGVLQAMMNEIIQTNPDFVQYCNPFKVMRIGKADVKLGEAYLRQCQKKMIQGQAAQKAQDSQMNAQAQQQSAQMAAQMEMQKEQMKAQYESQKNADLSRADKEKITLSGLFAIWTAGVAMPEQLQAVAGEAITNIILPLFAENTKNKLALSQGMNQLAQAQGQQPGGPAQQPGADQQQSPDQSAPDQSQPDPSQTQNQQ
jgi:hypothetical protein